MKLPDTIGSPDGPTVEGASAELLRELLRELDKSLEKARFPVRRLLNPGTSEERVRVSLANLGLVAPDELVTWFAWHDGRDRSEKARYFVPGFSLWPLTEVIASYEDPDYEPHGIEEWEWDPRWLHFAGPNVGLAMRCDGNPADPPLVRNVASDSEFGTQPNQTSRQVVSLCAPVTWWIDSLRHGWYQWQSDVGRWHSDETQQSPIRALRGMS
jgi:hypothetical protein